MDKEVSTGYSRLEQQISWYDKKSGSAQLYYKWGKTLVIIASATIPIASLLNYKYLVVALGALIAIIEASQHLNQWQHNWITYRSTCEALRHEKYTFLEKADPYSGYDEMEARKLLVERTESLISTEHSKWIASQEKSANTSPLAETRTPKSPN